MKLISQIATTLFGLLAGGMLLIATGLLPYWRALAPVDFTQAFATSLPTVGGTMTALSMLATGLMILAAGLSFWRKMPGQAWLAVGAAGTVIMLATVFFYFRAANPLLAGGTLSAEAITAELATWQQMHWFRTIVGILGFLCAVRAGYAVEEST